MSLERLKNETAAIKNVSTNTNIPVPTLRCAFEDNGHFYIITDVVPGIPMVDLSSDQKLIVMKEIEVHLQTLQGVTSSVLGGLLGDVCLPFRLLSMPHADTIKFKEENTP
jgi:hypothetical protein